jgi:hypothetical protein
MNCKFAQLLAKYFVFSEVINLKAFHHTYVWCAVRIDIQYNSVYVCV